MITVAFLSLILTSPAPATEGGDAGETLFQAKACNACHHPTKDQSTFGLGPSIQMIASAYQNAGGQEALVRFLSADPEAKPIVQPELYAVMKAQQAVTKSLSDEERQALAAFILKQGQPPSP